jgi:protein phosphatase
MGAAVVVALLRGAWGLLGHLGDCRAYLFHDGVLKRLTRDHSLVQLLLDSGDVTPAQAADHPARGQLTRYLGMETEPLPEARVVAMGAGDRLLLCSDGLTSQVGEDVIGKILGRVRLRTEACERLVTAANAAGGQDNVTALILDVLD